MVAAQIVATLASLLTLSLSPVALADNVTSLAGTWTSKSAKVFTGPGFYDPVGEQFFEPNTTGMSYSFTDDGFFESALYTVVSNATNPKCPQAFLQWQHGTYVLQDDGKMILNPIAVDGRQLQSDPCTYSKSLYTRWNETVTMKSWEILIDAMHENYRLNLYEFDGSPMNPMYLAYRPAMMLPTATLNPTATATASTASKKRKRSLGVAQAQGKLGGMEADTWWWIGAGMTVLGGVGFLAV
ncbi:protein rot1 precursor [Saitoella complicata NRRL Y-17804]|uniref:protein rot1 precursor n=1 Tax=Saitoella complicata (strain BCRC 22490 / CBS 7301 / JCM 7358 / NBRC 10748 / NRRL Y-17804) TaxID=698492 RepID=UPI0008680A1F|nr:protein rot1 precursor [Saitoella complicata NRRL Y-17804]ODQ51564.1 protein rot1 precursor [Saitoella complicata NRRL Y-17804]